MVKRFAAPLAMRGAFAFLPTDGGRVRGKPGAKALEKWVFINCSPAHVDGGLAGRHRLAAIISRILILFTIRLTTRVESHTPACEGSLIRVQVFQPSAGLEDKSSTFSSSGEGNGGSHKAVQWEVALGSHGCLSPPTVQLPASWG